MKHTSFLLVGLLVAGSGLVSAQLFHRGGGREEPMVLLYAQPNFRGDAVAVYAGDGVSNLGDVRFPDGSRANDRVRSIEVVGRVSVVVYEHSDFRGRVLRTTGDVRDLSRRYWPESPVHWGNRISSLRVDYEGGGRRGPEWLGLAGAERLVEAAYRNVLARVADPAGRGFYARLVLEQGWTAAMVEDALRASGEYRSERVDQFVHLAYRDVLQREADSAGLRHYRGLIVDHGWDVERIKADLRRSAEYRQRWVGRR